MWGFEQPIRESLSIGGRESADLGHRIVCKIWRVRMLRIQTILQQLRQEPTVRGMQADLRRVRGAGEGIGVETPTPRHGGAGQTAGLPEVTARFSALGIQSDAIELSLRGTRLGRR